MKIIKQGERHDSNWTLTVTCGWCGCEFEVEKKDLLCKYSGDPMTGEFIGFQCPQEECGKLIDAPDWVIV